MTNDITPARLRACNDGAHAMTNDDTAALVARAKELLANATPGPWILDDTLVYALRSVGWRRGKEQFENRFSARVDSPPDLLGERLVNAALIAAAPTLITDLAAALERAQADAARMREALEEVDANTPTQSFMKTLRSQTTQFNHVAFVDAQQALANIGDIARAALGGTYDPAD